MREQIPIRDDFSRVYRFLKANTPLESDVSVLFYRLRELVELSFCKLLIILDAMAECGLINVESCSDMYRVEVQPVSGKVDLESASIMEILRE